MRGPAAAAAAAAPMLLRVDGVAARTVRITLRPGFPSGVVVRPDGVVAGVLPGTPAAAAALPAGARVVGAGGRPAADAAGALRAAGERSLQECEKS
eukprot:gene8507-9898_t